MRFIFMYESFIPLGSTLALFLSRFKVANNGRTCFARLITNVKNSRPFRDNLKRSEFCVKGSLSLPISVMYAHLPYNFCNNWNVVITVVDNLAMFLSWFCKSIIPLLFYFRRMHTAAKSFPSLLFMLPLVWLMYNCDQVSLVKFLDNLAPYLFHKAIS